MAIADFNWNPISATTSFNDDGSARTIERVAQIITDDAADDDFDILPDGRIPKWGDAHPDEPLMTVRNRRLERESNSFIAWRLTVEYSDATGTAEDKEKQAKQLEPNPLLRPAEIEWEGVPREVAIYRDRLGDAICNSAGDYFDPPITATVFDTVAIITKLVPSVPLWLFDYQGAVNNASFQIDGITAEAGSALMGPLKISKRQSENGFEFRVLQIPLHFRVRRDPVGSETEAPEAWKLELLDQGLRYKDGSNRKHIMDDSPTPQPVTSPVPLNGSGAKLANPSASNLVFLEYDIRKRRDFSQLPLT